MSKKGIERSLMATQRLRRGSISAPGSPQRAQAVTSRDNTYSPVARGSGEPLRRRRRVLLRIHVTGAQFPSGPGRNQPHRNRAFYSGAAIHFDRAPFTNSSPKGHDHAFVERRLSTRKLFLRLCLVPPGNTEAHRVSFPEAELH